MRNRRREFTLVSNIAALVSVGYRRRGGDVRRRLICVRIPSRRRRRRRRKRRRRKTTKARTPTRLVRLGREKARQSDRRQRVRFRFLGERIRDRVCILLEIPSSSSSSLLGSSSRPPQQQSAFAASPRRRGRKNGACGQQRKRTKRRRRKNRRFLAAHAAERDYHFSFLLLFTRERERV